jgi:dTDP-4-amino-4,6-dideoxygalactose transaminase
MLDFARQYATLREELVPAVTAALDSQRFILGPAVDTFETAAAHACGTTHAIGCASGTDALWLAIAAANIGPGDSVITTPFSFFASASAIVRAGARPIFADIDPLTFNLSPQAAAQALTPDVKAILPVHLYGQCAEWDAFESLRQHHPGLLLLEDAAQAFGATWTSPSSQTSPGGQARPAGALGDAAAFSFYPTKNLSAAGDAGLLTTTSSQLATHARSLRAHGMTRRYFHDELGWNCRIDSIQAAVLEVKLKYLPAWNQRRRDLAARYNELFLQAGIATLTSPEKPATISDGVVLPYVHPRAQHVFHQYVVRVPRRDELRAHLTAHGIGSEIYYPLPLHLQQALLYLGYRPGDFPHAERAAAEVLALPIYPELRDDEQQTVVEAIRSFYA